MRKVTISKVNSLDGEFRCEVHVHPEAHVPHSAVYVLTDETASRATVYMCEHDLGAVVDAYLQEDAELDERPELAPFFTRTT